VDEVRVAQPADRAAVLATVVAAFAGDPCWTYLLGSDYPRLAPLFAGALFDQRVGDGTVWMRADAGSVALWDRPGASEDHGRKGHWAAFDREAGPGPRARLAAYDAALATASPAAPFWYLGVLATHPDRWGAGLASAVIEPGVARADEEGLACCLETSTPANRDFYQRRGFTMAAPVPFDGGPPTWWMTRPAPD
jgi:GNAT superfamily N-acetyltransferase